MGKKNKKNAANKQKAEGEKDLNKGISNKSITIAKKPAPPANKNKGNEGKSQKPNPRKPPGQANAKNQNGKPAMPNGVSKKQDNLNNKKQGKQANQKKQQNNGKIETVGAKKKVENNVKVENKNVNSKTKSKDKQESTNKQTKKETAEPEVTKINKREKTRLKSEMKKEIILKGKSPEKLSDLNLLKKKLVKLQAKPEPRSKKVQRKILLINSLLTKVKNDNKANVNKTHAPVDKTQKKPKENNTKPKSNDNAISNENTPANKFVVFVGNLQGDITKEILLEHFSSIGEIQKIRLPTPKRKNRRFAYIQLADEETRQKALNMHGTMLNDKPVNVLYADRKKGKNVIQSENAKLQAQRKTATLTDKQMIAVGKQLKNKKKKQKKPKTKAKA